MAGARLTALRLVGFKSFAERTVVEFGPGISAVVGPNGSGKSNLADALRWTLGEQGRMLRTRRSEDVIFAGSSSRRAVGMADVTLVVDNSDRLLPVDYGELEIGRRLYRSGESEYLLNRQRIRLRDLVELLDAGNLADNAFLFIGQGMVDQALALRPEERRPLFEEAAGVRRHERRRRQAEAELVEAEANLDRLRDVLAELRPQAKRLAAQAEQIQARRTAGLELAEGLLAAARARWLANAELAQRQQKEVQRARAAADASLVVLRSAEDEAAALSLAIAQRSDAERAERDELDRQRGRLTELRVSLARIESESSSLERDRDRVAEELRALEARVDEAVRVLAEPVADRDSAANAELDLVERQIAELEPAAHASDAAAQLRTRSAELEQQLRRRDSMAEAESGARSRAEDLARRLEAAEAERETAGSAAQAARSALDHEQAAVVAAQQAVDHAVAARSSAHERMAATEAELAAARSTLAALDAAVADDGLARAARARGGTLLGEGLEVDPQLRRAVAAALGAAATAFLVDEAAVEALAERRGTVAVRGVRAKPPATSSATSQLVEQVRSEGGGLVTEGVLRDPHGDVTRLIGRVVWLPTISAALAVRSKLPAGWRSVTVGGEVVDDNGVVTLSSGESVLDRRAEKEVAERQVAELGARLNTDRSEYERRREGATGALTIAQDAARALESVRQESRRGEEVERVTQRRAEQLLREKSWEQSQADRLRSDIADVDTLVTRLLGEVDRLRAEAQGIAKADGAGDRSVLRLQLVGRRDELRRQRDVRDTAARASDESRRRAELTVAMDEPRRTQLESESMQVSDRLGALEREKDALVGAVTEVDGHVRSASAGLETLLAAGAQERTRLVAAERAAVEARDKLRRTETASRDAEIAAMEAKLQLEQTREQLLLELATVGNDGTRVLRAAAGLSAEPETEIDDDSAAETMEDLLEAVVGSWQEANSRSEDHSPSPGRLSALRRRFNELGAGNPFAVEEYAEVRERLESLDAQRLDMETAILSTRELIASLSTLINDQFRTTFAALEDAFERRFHELFGGGDAELSLTMPDDISTTGIEIHARPPGKKRQPLSMLSGGERALTAVSLLLAMLEVRPVPFCVLDEVDAALDEANVGRFSKALRGLSEQTQFIVITHNRGTIEGADALYGVTLGDDAVSRVVSLRLPEAIGNGHHQQSDEDLTEALA